MSMYNLTPKDKLARWALDREHTLDKDVNRWPGYCMGSVILVSESVDPENFLDITDFFIYTAHR